MRLSFGDMCKTFCLFCFFIFFPWKPRRQPSHGIEEGSYEFSDLDVHPKLLRVRSEQLDWASEPCSMRWASASSALPSLWIYCLNLETKFGNISSISCGFCFLCLWTFAWILSLALTSDNLGFALLKRIFYLGQDFLDTRTSLDPLPLVASIRTFGPTMHWFMWMFIGVHIRPNV